jgi:hypothetical protein
MQKRLGRHKKTIEEFIKDAVGVHGGKYDYSSSQYLGNHYKMTIICPKHGEFSQAASDHLSGCGCPKCKIDKLIIRSTKSFDEFLEKARTLHKNKYDYSKVIYTNLSEKVIIICPKHGDFLQSPNDHLRCGGCSKCKTDKLIARNTKSFDEFLREIKIVHKNKYDYSEAKIEYVNRTQKITIICPKHGDFLQSPNCHLSGQGCPKCGVNERITKNTKTFDDFLNDAKTVHGDRYDYSKANYTNSKEKITIICPAHGEFLQSPHCHLIGQGCKKCGRIIANSKTTKSRKDFVSQSQKIHEKRQYDYSLVNYLGSHVKVIIICPKHGEFLVEPSNYLRGSGCPKCARENKIFQNTGNKVHPNTGNKEELIEKSKSVHGDKYDYSKIISYKNRETKVCIICKTHGEFWQTPHSHLDGQECPFCSREKMASIRRKSLKDFIKEAKLAHGNRYDYSKTKYLSMVDKVCIICKTHGEFWQTPDCHLRGKGCQICGKIQKSISQRKSKRHFIDKFREIHGNKYDYSKVKDLDSRAKICIICKIHGEYWQSVGGHKNGAGCPKCGRITQMNNTRWTTEEFVEAAIKIHGLKYDYSKSEYKGSEEKVIIICNRHGEFTQSPHSHLKGGGCRKCKGGVILKGGIYCDSFSDAYYYLYFKNNNIEFEYNKIYGAGLGKKRFDFYLVKENKYVEVTNFDYHIISGNNI